MRVVQAAPDESAWGVGLVGSSDLAWLKLGAERQSGRGRGRREGSCSARLHLHLQPQPQVQMQILVQDRGLGRCERGGLTRLPTHPGYVALPELERTTDDTNVRTETVKVRGGEASDLLEAPTRTLSL